MSALYSPVDYHWIHLRAAVDRAIPLLSRTLPQGGQMVNVDLGSRPPGNRAESLVTYGNNKFYVRARRPEFADKYSNDFTVRYREKGQPSKELDRLLLEEIDFLVYAYGLEDEDLAMGRVPDCLQGRIISLRVWRDVHYAYLKDGREPGEYMPGGARSFRYKNYPGLLVASWDVRGDDNRLFPVEANVVY